MKFRHLRTFVAIAVTASAVMLINTQTVNASVPAPFDQEFGTNGLAIHELPLQQSESVAADVISDASGDFYVLLTASAGANSGVVTVAKFSRNGSVVSAFGNNGRSPDLQLVGSNFALQADGKIVVSGFQYTNNQTKITVYRLTSSGQIDSTFGVDGAYIIPSFPGKNIGSSSLLLAVNQSNSRIHIAFNVSNFQGNNQNFYFITLDTDGQLDYTWSNGGAEEVVPRGGPVSAYSSLNSIYLLADGSLLGIGSAISTNGVRAIVLTKLDQDGYLDATYDGVSNGDGVVFVQFALESDAFMTAGTVLQDDSIVLAGLAGTYYFGPWFYGAAKILADGTVDTTFGTSGFALSNLQTDENTILPKRIGTQTDGRFVFNIGSGTTGGFMRVESDGTFSNTPQCSQCLWSGVNDNALATSLLVQTDGKVVVTGQHRTDKDSIIRRFAAEGSSDGTFNNSTIQIKADQWESDINSVKPQPDGSILGLGTATLSRGYGYIYKGLVYKFTANGDLDSHFGLGGYQFLSPPTSDYWLSINDFAVLPSGKILVLGSGGTNDQSVAGSVMLWRLNSNGTLDGSFGTNGFTITTDSVASLYPRAMILSSDEKITVPLGRYGGAEEQWIYRYTAGGTLDSSFTDSQNFAGGKKPTIGNGTGTVEYAASAENGKMLVAGSTTINSQTHSYLARFLADGTLDTSFSGGYVSWDTQLSYSMNYITKTYQDQAGKIYVLGATASPTKTGLLLQLNSDGTSNSGFNNSGYVSIAYRNPAQIDYSQPTDVVMDDGMFTIIGGGDSNPSQSRSASFSGVARISLSGAIDSSFGTNGIVDPFTAQESFFSDIAPLPNGENVIAGMLKQGSVFKVLLMKIGPSTSAPTTTVPPSSKPTTSSPETTLPPTTSPQLPTSTTVPAIGSAVDETIKLVISVSQATIMKRMKLAIPSGAKVQMKSSTAKVCRVVKTKVIATSPGTCRISVTVTDKKKKMTTKTTSFKVT
jgi:uncharacterized delta-60 repeat protein